MPNDLPTATLGRTGIEATRLGFGGMALRDESIKWPIEDEHAEAVLNTVLDCGVNFVDTADCCGRSEKLIGRFLSHRRDEYTLATKCGCIPNGRDWTRENLFKGLERSQGKVRWIGSSTPVAWSRRWKRCAARARCVGSDPRRAHPVWRR